MQSECEDILEGPYAITFEIKLSKNVTETYAMFQVVYGLTFMIRASDFG